MQRIIIIISVIGVLAACSWPSIYTADIHQGNVVTSKQVEQLKLGMQPNQVRYLLGTPLLTDPTQPNHWYYIHSIRQQGNTTEKKHLKLIFIEDELTEIIRLQE